MRSFKKALAVAVVAVVAGAPVAASAAELSGNVTMATDYVFRGFSQTDEKMAIQGGFDVDFGNGFYIGTWASNVDFGPNDASDSGAQAETDFYAGYALDINDNVSLDLSAIYFYYPGDASALDYQEYVASLGVGDFSFGLVYSPEYFGDGGPDAMVYNVDYSLGISDVASMDFHVGMSDADEDDFFGEDDSYIDYMVGFNYDVAGVTLTLAWYGTDLDDSDLADDRAVFSISKSL